MKCKTSPVTSTAADKLALRERPQSEMGDTEEVAKGPGTEPRALARAAKPSSSRPSAVGESRDLGPYSIQTATCAGQDIWNQHKPIVPLFQQTDQDLCAPNEGFFRKQSPWETLR